MASGTSQGARWIAILVLYFVLMTTIITLVGSAVTSVTGVTLASSGECSDPRNLLSKNGTIFTSDDTTVSRGHKQYIYNNMECAASVYGVTQTNCESISGCTWTARTCSWADIAWGYITGEHCIAGTNSCTGAIDGSTYGIDTYTYWFDGTERAVDLDSPFGVTTQRQHVCLVNQSVDLNTTASSPYNNQTSCEILGCTWLNEDEVNALAYQQVAETSRLSFNFVSEIWGTVSHLALLSYDFGFDNAMANILINLILFWLPALMLGLAGYSLLRG
jgi:hypothetical protein